MDFNPDGIEKPISTSPQGYDLHTLGKVSYEQFCKFLDNLDQENETWGLDLQAMENRKEWFEVNKRKCQGNFILLDGDEIIALYTAYNWLFMDKYDDISAKYIFFKDFLNLEVQSLDDSIDYKNLVAHVYSYVVKKEYQKQGLGHFGLAIMINFKTFQALKGIIDDNGDSVNMDLVFHVARTHTYNLGSRFLLKKLGFIPIQKINSANHITYCFAVDKNENIAQLQTDSKIDLDEDLYNLKKED
tara:strand:+ start:95 stop:826 length:732 start_codon:yes stop_codon:yes gene_type:complete